MFTKDAPEDQLHVPQMPWTLPQGSQAMQPEDAPEIPARWDAAALTEQEDD